MSRRQRSPVPADLATRIEVALADVDHARDNLAVSPPALADRRQAHRQMEAAFTVADALLREATELARGAGYLNWRQWRGRLSRLDIQWQQHLFAELDDIGVLDVGSVRAIDTGMSGPDIGDLQHGKSCPAGTPAHYGLDLTAALTAATREPAVGRRAAQPAPGRFPVADQPIHAVEPVTPSAA